MSDQAPFQLPPESPDDPPAIRQAREHIKTLEAALVTKDTELTATATVAKENAFLKAGIDITDPVAKMLFDSYSGELDVEKVKEAAVAVRLVPGGAAGAAAEGTPTGEPPPPDPTQTQERANLANDGGGANSLPPEDPVLAGYGDFHEALKAGQTREDASGAVLGRIIGAANAGDPRFKWDAATWANQEEAKAR